MTTQSVNLFDRIASVLPSADKMICLDLVDTTTLKQDLADFRAGSQPLSKNFLVTYVDPHDDERKQAWLFSGSYSIRVLSELFGEASDYSGELEILHCAYARDSELLVYPEFIKPFAVPSKGDKFEGLIKALTEEQHDAHKKYVGIVDHNNLFVGSPRVSVTQDKATVIFTTYVQGNIGNMLAAPSLPFSVEKSEDAMVDFLKGCEIMSCQAAGLSTYRQIMGIEPFGEYMNFVISRRNILS